MSPRELSNRRIHEVREALASYRTALPDTDVNVLAKLCHAVLASIDVRDLRDLPTVELIEQLEYVLDTVKNRKSGQIKAQVRRRGDEHIVLESCVDDKPFLVSAVRALLASEGFEVRSALNAVTKLRRDRRGNLIDFNSGTRESIIRVEVRVDEGYDTSDEALSALRERLEQRLRITTAMVGDFSAMKAHIRTLADEYAAAAAMSAAEVSVDLREAEGLLRWLCDDNYVIFSVEEYNQSGDHLTALGTASVVAPKRDEDLLQSAASSAERLVRYQRSHEESPVHRAGKPGHFVFTAVSRAGDPTGVTIIDGLFTYKALHTPPEDIPYLRGALRDFLRDREVAVDSHRGKSITNAFNSLPIEYLLAESRDNVWELTDRVLRAEEEGGSDVHIQVGEGGRFAFVFVSLPREQFSEELRVELQELLLAELGASYSDYGVYLDRYDNAIIHFYVTAPGPLRSIDTDSLRAKVHAMAKGWGERLRESLQHYVREDHPSLQGEEAETKVQALYAVYHDAFNEEHRRRAADERLVGDLRCIENLREGAPLDCDLFISRTGDHPGSLNLRVFSRDLLTLSAQLPVIGSFGVDVIDQYTRELKLPHEVRYQMHTFRLDVRRERHRAVLGRAAELTRGLRAVYSGVAGRDQLNRLIAVTNMRIEEVRILRAYVAYLHQLGVPFDTELIIQVLVRNPSASQALLTYLAARFDPNEGRVEASAALRTVEAELRSIADYTDDRVLQAVAEVVRATVRTNAFILGPGDALAFKINGKAVSFGPSPKPFREIWVYHPQMEGVHLRGGKVARGGLRFSDRPDDFRTEIHGLMATQMVKNVLIVPMGAKGGFVLRKPPADRKRLREAGDSYYQIFIKALLSVTDNVVEGEPVTPEGIIHTEEPDPYLVVAADKGTAHLSDTANAISMKQGFWLDDAFASGGSNGYDHKATGITARGAWESTKRCFHELGLDPESDVITAIGVGDMSGDVFGNGLLRSRSVKLLAAFNHMHVFIDPDPDPERSYAERLRLFETPGSTWADYDAGVLSEGGGVYPRKSKEVPVSARARELLGFLPEDVISGDELIKAVMRLSVDLFWMGGIGTYVKAHDETHAEVGDKANDAVRVDARDLSCRVFTEGANLAITDRGRVELSRRGCHIYTAFLDNSGGVDTSDHEVNIKILFQPLLAAGFSRDQRNTLLQAVEDEVCDMVLANNRSQSRMVSYDVRRSIADLWRYARTMELLRVEVPFEPESFAMPNEDELANRHRKGEGLFKCEGAVLGSHAKMLAYRELLADEPLPEEIAFDLVRGYFPAQVVETASEEVLRGHLLFREIATTVAVNHIVDSAGCTFFTEMTTVTGRSYRDVAVAYLQARELGGVGALLDDLFALEDKHAQEGVYRAMERIGFALEDAAFYLLGPIAEGGVLRTERARVLLSKVVDLLPPSSRHRARYNRHVRQLTEKGVPEALAEAVARLRFLSPVLDTLMIARREDADPEAVLRVRLGVSDAMRMSELQSAISRMELASPWDGPAVQSLGRQLEFHTHKMTLLVEDEGVEAMIEAHGLTKVQKLIGQCLDGDVTVASLVMLDGQLRRLLPPIRGTAA
ncbi:NAD-glutamate dehydrogenase [Pseudenhygromyxa sp. WMMC2535]|uniref:NAD-glutamate dehydrogenase domain-containing protein n=1 Tax=Pseudenhygromyxa sp. WMMC2535 TaxID=2712867 RepID=UPI00155434B4|nr:NAD-glutamate dehydrogenase domain-containing protein [Pseudenhygromyxa sp. WMMC2535]NVB42038.1 NAD-glutamate dehydrogenase [Pseudenhygromyxa sp. WMMC2535]